MSRRLTGLLALVLVSLALAAPAAAHTLYVGGAFGSGVASLEIGPGGALKATLNSPSGSGSTNGVALTPDGNHLIATDPGLGKIYTYDVNGDGSLKPTGGLTVPAPADPDGIAISPDGKHAYVTDAEPEAILIYAIAANGELTPAGTVPLPGADFTQGIAITPDGSQVFAVTANPPARVYGFNVVPGGGLTPQTPAFVSSIPGAEGLSVRPGGETLYVSGGTSGVQAFALEGGTLAELKGSPFATGVGRHGLAVSPLGTHVFVTRTGEPKGSLESFAIGEFGSLAAVGAPVEAAGITNGIAVSPNGSLVYSAGDIAKGGVSTFAIAAGAPTLAFPTPFDSNVLLSQFDSLAVSPNQPPAASFTATQEGRGNNVQFSAAGSADRDGTIARYDWDFGDGTKLENGGPAPAHTYPGPGNYSASLTLTDAEGCSTTFVFTGQTASCNGNASARAAHQVVVADPPPRLRLFGPLRQKLGPTVTLRASCDKPCTLNLRSQVLVLVPGAKPRMHKLRVLPKTRRLAPNRRVTVKLTLPRATRNATASGLAIRGSRANVRVTAVATDTRAQRTKATRSIRLTLPR